MAAVEAEGAVDAWAPMAASVRGAKHVRDSRTNQDAFRYLPQLPAGEGQTPPPLVMSVADGHGDPRSPRSQQGAVFAVETATEVLWRFLQKTASHENLLVVKRLAEDMLAKQIEREWQRKVDEELAQKPLTPEETRALQGGDGIPPSPGSAVSEGHRRLAYGTTLVVSAVAPDFLLHLQIGDGDILMVSEGGEVMAPVPPDAGLVGDQTLSLSREGAWQDFRLRFYARSRADPALLWLSTDGLSKSFPQASDFQAFARDVLASLRREGARHVGESLPGMLEQTSRDGSGDDITLGLLFRMPSAGPGRASERAGGAHVAAKGGAG